MCSRHDGTDARFAFRYGRESDAGAHDAFFEQLAGEVHRELAVADDNGRDWSFAGGSGAAADVESQQPELWALPQRLRLTLFRSAR